jgi:signal transduction histidine kinase
MAKTIDALMAFARNESTEHVGTTDLVELVREFEGVTVVADGHVPLAEADPDLVRQALAPILDNARRHARTAVSVTLGSRTGEVLAIVSDDGDGVDPAIARTVFDPGVRDAAAGDGAGLGLPLARRLARSCGGDLVLLPGPGARFELSLPAREG